MYRVIRDRLGEVCSALSLAAVLMMTTACAKSQTVAVTPPKKAPAPRGSVESAARVQVVQLPFGSAKFVQSSDGNVKVTATVSSKARRECENSAKGTIAEGNVEGPEGVVQVLSVAGDVVSYKVEHSQFCGEAHPIGHIAWHTLSMRTGKRVPLSSLFELVDVNAALKSDAFLQQSRQAKDFGFDTDVSPSTDSFAVFSAADGKVGVRVRMLPMSDAVSRDVYAGKVKAPTLGLHLTAKDKAFYAQCALSAQQKRLFVGK